jgi:hypothetical protein
VFPRLAQNYGSCVNTPRDLSGRLRSDGPRLLGKTTRQSDLVGPSAAAEGGVAWGLVYVRCGGDRAVELHTAPIRRPSPRIRACIVCVEGVRGAVCAAVSSLRKLSSGGYRCHDRFPSDSW